VAIPSKNDHKVLVDIGRVPVSGGWSASLLDIAIVCTRRWGQSEIVYDRATALLLFLNLIPVAFEFLIRLLQ